MIPNIIALQKRAERIENIMRANQLHESSCAWKQERDRVMHSPDPGMPVIAKCDCWLSDG